MSDFPIEVFTKLVVISAGLILFIRFFARRMPTPKGPIRAPLAADKRVGAYMVGNPIADGGTATVYEGVDPDGKMVAIKIPHASQLKDQQFIDTFHREAEIGTTLQHPSIVRVLEVGVYEVEGYSRIPYFVMELLQGQDLRSYIRAQGAVDPDEAAQMIRGVADALSWAHQRGVLHRDISPRNIFVTPQKIMKLMDFGVSTVFSRTDKRFVNQALALGTPKYLAPERQTEKQTDPRSDIYSLGCVLYEMVCGEPPFTGENPKAILAMHRKAAVIRPSQLREIPPRLENVIMKMLEKDPEKRYQSAGEVASALADLRPDV